MGWLCGGVDKRGKRVGENSLGRAFDVAGFFLCRRLEIACCSCYIYFLRNIFLIYWDKV